MGTWLQVLAHIGGSPPQRGDGLRQSEVARIAVVLRLAGPVADLLDLGKHLLKPGNVFGVARHGPK